MTTTALYVPLEDCLFQPTPLTGGPWRSDAQHGSPPAALLAHGMERILADAAGPDWRIARLSVELVKPVPLTPLSLGITERRVSKRVWHLHTTLSVDEPDGGKPQIVAEARGLALATATLPEPGWRPIPMPSTVPGPDAHVAGPVWASGAEQPAYHRHGVEFRFVSGTFDQPSDADTWVRLRQPVIDGLEPSPLERVMAAVDFGSGVSAVYDNTHSVGMINADLTTAVHRHPVGEWVHLQSVTRIGPDGIGLCTTTVGDEHGPIGASTQSLIGLHRT